MSTATTLLTAMLLPIAYATYGVDVSAAVSVSFINF